MLLGGNALLIRTGGGRFTQDIDLARETPWDSAEEALDELRRLAARPHRGDPFEFGLHSVASHREADPYGYGADTAKIKATATLGGQVFENFSIDLTARRHLDAPVDQVRLKPVIDHEILRDLPAVPTTPVEHHLADKICALYERHAPDDAASTRYRDLADIVRIVADLAFDAARLATVLAREAGRRRMTLPAALTEPSTQWRAGFPRAARSFAEYPPQYRELEPALAFCGNCLDEVLAGARTAGSWDPARAAWQ
ncbi:Nucleotidyl transferase AbiEii toxin, Type IV TA system [Amycolatopsis rubida]|uniref:Nucleotidyl transferase AbiEii toxin, Type IV TA system n=1 Tax=Amycolatopsis rubida TaxID=112413 RepID=A0A1I6BM16_9PSEU|nr:Nucleotidyl transferase AbiEii toxin, Type IV TA system [Amycolatopsis rubida]